MLFIHFLQEKFASSDILCIFAATESATLPIEQRTRVGLLLYMSSLRIYTKQALTIADQLELLKSRGLLIADDSKASKFLGEVSYFRFVQYLRPMEANKTTHQFKPNSRFADAVALYEFDTELRDLVFKAVQRLEIALRTKIIHEFSIAHGPFWFYDTSLAEDEHKFIENMNAIDRELQRSKDDFIKEHKQNYDKPVFPPAWKTLELASFGTLSKLYYNCQRQESKETYCQTVQSAPTWSLGKLDAQPNGIEKLLRPSLPSMEQTFP